MEVMEVRQGPPPPVEEGEVITEENVYDRYDAPMGFFPGQVMVDLTSSAVLLVIVVVLFAVPWLDKEPGHSPLRRPFMSVVAFLIIATVVLNMILAILRIANFPGGSP